MARTKYSERLCGYCNKTTRMESMGGTQNAQEKAWYRCTRCHHMSLLEVGLQGSALMKEKIDSSSATMYNPEQIFKVGDAIFHTQWNDFGKVVSKVRTSDGNQAIVVSFEKQGQRTLIENLKSQ